MSLENMLNATNKYYLDKDLALIYKKPTPINTVKVSYENSSKIINKAYFKAPSTLDYNGIYKGKYLEFEAKETRSKTSFPLSNIHPHQVNHLRSVIKHGGIAFLIISMNDNVFLLKGEDFLEYIENVKKHSITIQYIKEKGSIIKLKYEPQCDYLSIVDNIYF